MAVSLAGSPELVAACMQCTRDAFYDYCSARKEPSWDEIERLLSFLTHEHGRLIAEHRELSKAAQSARKGG